MVSILKNHPFPVEAFFESSIVLTFAATIDQLQKFVPPCLDLDTYNDEWAFLAVAMVQTKNLRPKGFPAFLGNDFFLIGFRLFVRRTNAANKRLRGLYILKSETDRPMMSFFGNLFTHYNYTTTDIQISSENGKRKFRSQKSDFEIIINDKTQAAELPNGSPFNDWKSARRFAGPLPFTFTVGTNKKTILTIEGVRTAWHPLPIDIESQHFGFLDKLGIKGLVLANAFEIKNVPYYWKKGSLATWR
jgi:uncharacterized protein YqjF (DUF2071 family)